MNLRSFIKRAVNAIGFDIVRLRNSPRHTSLGFGRLDFGSVIDVGANEGQFARWIGNFTPQAVKIVVRPLFPHYFHEQYLGLLLPKWVSIYKN